jgi:hypothetical protein
MVTRYRKTLKTVENLAEKPDLTLGSCLHLEKLFVVGGVMKFARICKNLKKKKKNEQETWQEWRHNKWQEGRCNVFRQKLVNTYNSDSKSRGSCTHHQTQAGDRLGQKVLT